MQKFKSFFVFMMLGLLLSGCGEYHKVLNKGKNTEKYKLAVDMYEQGEYKRCIPLFEKLVGPYANKPQMERIQYMISDCYGAIPTFRMRIWILLPSMRWRFVTNL